TVDSTANAKDGKIVFDVVVENGYAVESVLVDKSIPARTQEDGSYIIEGILTDETTVDVTTVAVETESESETESETEVAKPAFDFSGTEDGVTATIKADEGVFPAGTKVDLKALTDADREMIAAAAGANPEDVIGLDITFTYEGKEIQPEGNVSVSFAAAEIATAEVDTVYHIDNGAVEEVTASQEGESLGFTSDSFSPFGISLTAAKNTEYTVEVGKTVTIEGTTSKWSHSWSVIKGNEFVTVKANKDKAVVTGKAEGTATIQHQYGTKKKNYTVTVTPGKVRVYVYVNSKDEMDKPYSQEALDLLQVDYVDQNGYFPAGEITLDSSYFNGKDRKSSSLINSTSDWNKLQAALGTLDKSKLQVNKNNQISNYISQAVGDTNKRFGSQCTTLGYWVGHGTSYGFTDQTVEYHLDLRFRTNRIIFKTGNNDIKTGAATDGNEVDNRVYITGSEIQEPRNVNIPNGYKFVGYYQDADFKTPWNGIGTALTADQTVYLKIAPMKDVTVYYVPVGNGTVTLDSEHFNPKTGKVSGSEATPALGSGFVGWYSDKECKNLVSDDKKFSPAAPDDEWKEGDSYTYYAKFTEKTGRAGYNLVLASAMWNGNIPQNLKNTEAQKYHYTYGFAKDDTFTVISDVPIAQGYAFIGWHDKYRGADHPSAIRNAGDKVTYIYKDSKDYTLDALWASLNATGGTWVYDGTKRSITTDININEGTGLAKEYADQAKELITAGDLLYSTDKEHWSTTKPEFIDVGEYTVYVKEDVTVGDRTTTLTGEATVTINPVEIEITAKSAEKQYDGTALTNSGYDITKGSFIGEDGFASVAVKGSQTIVGESDNTITGYELKKGTKSQNYTITTKKGKLKVTDRDTKYEVTVVAKSTTATYDGNNHEAKGVETYEFTIDGVKYTVSGLT
ncbi:MAG: InlB B-repeat-containing protein, partial [Lachnospiraceae bacterium]|nr:InlB B-repeat-containing protein [Lachnospiraceae bacterium]